jgi:predicted nucleic acid-binding protein
MKKDTFIDNNIASQYFSNPTKEEYKDLVEWLLTHNKNKDNDAYLIVSPYLLREYHESNRNANSRTNIIKIIEELTKQERLVLFSKKHIEVFQQKYFSNKVLKKLLSNAQDRNHIPVVLMSDRKIALSEDNKFIHDLNQISEFTAITAKRPEELAYKD